MPSWGPYFSSRSVLGYTCTVVVLALIYALTPGKDAMMLMAGSEAVDKIVTNPAVTDTGGKVIEAINKYLDDYLVGTNSDHENTR